jgi:hypothetical protein
MRINEIDMTARLWIIAAFIFISCLTNQGTSKVNDEEKIQSQSTVDTSRNENFELQETRFDPRAANFSYLFENKGFIFSSWDTTRNEGFAVLPDHELLYLKGWASDELGFHCKILINDSKFGVSEKNISYWLDETLRYSNLLLSADEIQDVKNAISTKNYNFDKANKLYMVIGTGNYLEFWIAYEEINMSTIILQFYVNRDI